MFNGLRAGDFSDGNWFIENAEIFFKIFVFFSTLAGGVDETAHTPVEGEGEGENEDELRGGKMAGHKIDGEEDEDEKHKNVIATLNGEVDVA